MSKRKKVFNTGDLMLELNKSLSIDLANISEYPLRPTPTTILEIRNHEWSDPFSIDDGLHVKILLQLRDTLKRFTFQNDKFSLQELEDNTNAKFVELQTRLAASYTKVRTTRLHAVLQRTRKIVREILGRFDESELIRSCQFGIKSTVGCPAKDAYIDHKLLNRPITGSEGHMQWFKENYLPADDLLRRAIRKSRYRLVDVLSQVNVPKNHKILRGITPNTLIGTLHSSGLGRMFETRLRMRTPIDIRKQQYRHGRKARKASLNRKHVTADLSNASNMYLSNLLNACLPRRWFNEVMRGVVRSVKIRDQGEKFDGTMSTLRLESIMTMGIGFTFPLQTLLFYGILKAIAELTNVLGDISVYGDDLIYPVALHKYVVGIFDDLGFQLNKEKTYATGNFRESCGSDFYRGVDVRPFSPEGCEENLSPSRYAAFCYKLLNGINRRWDPVCYDLNRTRNLLLKEILRVKTCIYRVPMSYPDTSGMKTDMLHAPRSEWYIPYAKIFWDTKLYLYRFPFLQATTRTRIVDHHVAYLWDWLRAHDERVSPEIPDLRTPDRAILPRYIAYETAQDMLGQQLSELSTFKWETTPYVKRDPVTGRRIRRRVATVAEKLCEPWYVETLSYSKDNPPMSA